MMILKEFREYLENEGRAENTIRSYLGAVRGYMEWYRDTCGMDFQQLYRPNALDFISYLRTVKKLGNKSVNAKIAALISLNGFLIEAGVQTEMALRKNDYLKVQQQFANPCTVTKQQVEAFRQTVLVKHGKRDFAIVTLLAYAGLRISEALGLLLTDINLPAREVRVLGKGDKERVVFLNDKIVNAVQEYLGERDSASPYLFVSRKGGRLDRSAMNRISNACSDAITPHMLRHFFCTSAEEAGYSTSEIANQAGHSNIHTTLIYTNPTREKMKEKANRL